MPDLRQQLQAILQGRVCVVGEGVWQVAMGPGARVAGLDFVVALNPRPVRKVIQVQQPPPGAPGDGAAAAQPPGKKAVRREPKGGAGGKPPAAKPPARTP